ncbi:hypothetical protein FHS83_002305 [Rhizomicrobium palustre]|uniref:Uncharacterized protein n=1 Tax=Rhizomicrobium palustre TaxID=189966 RepID=A0A846N1F2_9PROT|nr:hypothetical protein [Rhizomicrobium palustre]NIK88987.1 hypothetical protein [Rhizomicrobium palustre]
MHLRIAFQISQDERRHDLAGGCREGIDAQGAGRGFLLGTRRIHRLLNAVERRLDLGDEDPPCVSERNAARGPIEQPHGQLPLKLLHSIADGGGRHPKFERRRPKRAASHNRQNGFEFD